MTDRRHSAASALLPCPQFSHRICQFPCREQEFGLLYHLPLCFQALLKGELGLTTMLSHCAFSACQLSALFAPQYRYDGSLTKAPGRAAPCEERC